MRRTILFVGVLVLSGCGGEDYSVPTMMEQLKSSDVEERATAISVIKTYGPEAGPAAEAVAEALDDPNPGMRVHAAYALAAIGPNAAPTLPALYRALQSSDPELRLAAVYAIPLVAARDDSAIVKLKPALKDKDIRIREEAEKSIRQLELAAKHSGSKANPSAN